MEQGFHGNLETPSLYFPPFFCIKTQRYWITLGTIFRLKDEDCWKNNWMKTLRIGRNFFASVFSFFLLTHVAFREFILKLCWCNGASRRNSLCWQTMKNLGWEEILNLCVLPELNTLLTLILNRTIPIWFYNEKINWWIFNSFLNSLLLSQK